MSYTTELARYVAELRYEDLPAATVAAAKRVTLDVLGVTLAAVTSQPGKIMTEYVAELAGKGRASVIGSGIRVSPPDAAMANGTLAAEMELDDVHPSNLHASSVFVPAMLAVAEAHGATGREWITALVAAYDVGCRLSYALGDRDQYSRGFHPTAVSGTFGAAAGAAKLLRLDAADVVSTFGLAGCQAAGLLTWEQEQEHYTKSFQSGVPARNAVTAAALAERGYVGAPDTLDGPHNVFDAFSNSRNFGRLSASLGSRFEIEHTGYKFYACCRYTHSTLDALFDLIRQHDLRADAVDSVRVWLGETAAPIVDANVLTTHNLQHIVSVALHDGHVHREQCSADRRKDASVRALAGRVSLMADPELEKLYPAHWAGRISVRTRDGRELCAQRDDPRGSFDAPASDAEIAAKFRNLAHSVLSDGQVNQLVDTIRELESMNSVAQFAELLAPVAASAGRSR